ncbi:MAG: hypothetical protein IJS02_00595 [Bacteroidales bacterium]|nr:hypothetical protein [Bacteroidales bacterium]
MIKKVLLLAIASFALVACNNAAKMAELADQVNIACNPEVLEVVAGNIDADVTVTFPAEYFYPKAILEVIPVIVYDGGEAVGAPFIYQGEKVTQNYKTVSKNQPTSITEHVNFKYVPGMEKSQLVARAKVVYKGTEYAFPSDIKIADGANTTYMLVKQSGAFTPKADNYQEVIPEELEAQVLYLINSSQVRNNQLTSANVKDYQAGVTSAMNDERRTVKGTEIVAYASPDGPEALNNKLSANRETSAAKAFQTISKKLETGAVDTKSIGEDWEGFKELVNASNIEDKDLILRVLSMYSDPAVREREIKNMSSVYKTLANNVLPQLRRARFITSVEYQNYTPDELTHLVNSNIDVLDEEALLRAATLANTSSAKLAIYKQAINKFNSARAKFNSALVCLEDNNVAQARSFLGQLDSKDPDVANALGVCALRDENYSDAARYFATSTSKDATLNQAVLDILNGSYATAAQKLAGSGSCNEALAYILTNQLDKASNVLKDKTCTCSAYQRAIVAARKGYASTAKEELQKASSDAALAARALKDIEFSTVK